MAAAEFKSLNIAVLTVSDTRGEAEDVSGKLLVEALQKAGHVNIEKSIVKDDIFAIRAIVSRWIADPEVDAVLTTGGARFGGRGKFNVHFCTTRFFWRLPAGLG